PPAPVYGIAVQEHFNDLVVGTYGRGYWIMDDITPLQQMTAEVMAQDAHLFKPRLAYRFRQVEATEAVPGDPSTGQNPAYGATINYWLKAAPSADPTITILDDRGALVQTIRGTRTVGVNRVRWDLRYESTRAPRLRVPPLYAPEITIPADGLPAPSVGSMSILAPPGTYTVKLNVGGREFSQQLEVRKDPNSGGSLEGIRAQTAFLQEVQRSVVSSVGMIDTLQRHRSRLGEVRGTLAGSPTNRDLVPGADSLEQKVIAVEDQLHQLKTTGRGQDGVRWPVKVAGQLLYLAGTAAGSDEGPTAQAREAQRYLDDRLAAARRDFQRVMGELEAYLARLRARNVISEE
ncbi:MAG TPA: hypothetical protein VI383_11775, partial [Gemmatimonadales bacterium]|nr:hypothetical protein [Gemmatimonadales bacterium]